MIVDSSAIVAILSEEEDTLRLVRAISNGYPRRLPASCLLEAAMVLVQKQGLEGIQSLDRFLLRSRMKVLPFTEFQARLAREAFLRYGKGRHPAKLNFGDCMSYAAAKATGEELLFKGNDFAQTDIAVANY
jgi:ribonuclease VapC